MENGGEHDCRWPSLKAFLTPKPFGGADGFGLQTAATHRIWSPHRGGQSHVIGAAGMHYLFFARQL